MMAITGVQKKHISYTVTTEGVVTTNEERDLEVQIKVCDICGADATGRSACDKCKRDLCGEHQVQVNHEAVYRHGKEVASMEHPLPAGVYCKDCLLELVKKL